MDLVLDREAFIYVLIVHHVFHLVIIWVWCKSFCEIVLFFMILIVALIFKKICGHITHDHVPPSKSHLLVASRLLALEKQIESV